MIRRSKKAMRTTSIIVGMFVACWIPYSVLHEFTLIFAVVRDRSLSAYSAAAAAAAAAAADTAAALTSSTPTTAGGGTVFDDQFFVSGAPHRAGRGGGAELVAYYTGEPIMTMLKWLRRLDDGFYVLLLFNGVIDPIIYALRMRHVRRGIHGLGTRL